MSHDITNAPILFSTNMTIAFRILLSVLSTIVVVLVPMTYFSYRATLNVIEKQFRMIRPVFAELLDTHVAGEMKNFEMIARMTVREVTGTHLDTPKEHYELFRNVLTENPSVVGFGIALDPDGPHGRKEAWYLFQDGQNRLSDWVDLVVEGSLPPYTELDWYTEPAKTGKPYWTKPYLGRTTGIPMITYSQPLFDAESRFTGVLLCDVSIRWLNDFITQLELPRTEVNEIFLLSQDGMILADQHWGYLYKNIFDVARETGDAGMEAIARKMLEGEHGYMEYRDPDGKRSGMIIYMSIDDGDNNGVRDWSLGIFVPQESLKGFAMSVGRRQAMIGLGGLAIMLVLLLFVSHSISKPIRQLQEAALSIASGQLDAKVPDVHGKDEISHLAESFTRMQHDLKTQIASLAETTRRKEQMESDLRISRRIQMSLVPKRPLETGQSDRFDLAAFMEPAKDVGGDFYDYFMLDDRLLCLVVADVSGKGVPAALLMTRGSAFFRTYLQATRRLAFSLELVNRELARDNDACMFITLFAAVVDLQTGICHYAGAGHNPPFLVRRGKRPKMLADTVGLPLGIDEGQTYKEIELRLMPGELIYLYSDGVTEAMSPDTELFGEERTEKTLTGLDDRSCQDVIDRMLEAIGGFVTGAEQSDDITMIAFRYRGT